MSDMEDKNRKNIYRVQVKVNARKRSRNIFLRSLEGVSAAEVLYALHLKESFSMWRLGSEIWWDCLETVLGFICNHSLLSKLAI